MKKIRCDYGNCVAGVGAACMGHCTLGGDITDPHCKKFEFDEVNDAQAAAVTGGEVCFAGAEESCRWTYDSEYCAYETACDEIFCFIEGDTEDNHYNFCPKCGKKIEAVEEEPCE